MVNTRWLVLVAAVGCSTPPVPAPPDQAVADLSTGETPDQAATPDSAMGSPIGGPCKATGDCEEGASRICWTHSLYNRAGNVKTPDGYCSSKCTDDSQCGANGVCINEGSSGSWCFAPCEGPADCRTGYGCFLHQAGHCFPSSGLECDPTAGDGTCKDGRACDRYALGTGLTGYCFDTCDIGPNSCSPSNGAPRQCAVLDFRGRTDASGTKLGDKFHGPMCVVSYADNADGTSCTDANGNYYVDACVDGDECAIGNGGDRKCHPLCHPTPGDGGTPAGDGGVPPGACPPKSTCTDWFGLFGTAHPIGLCR